MEAWFIVSEKKTQPGSFEPRVERVASLAT
jgi:hypothetical protein